MKIGGGMRPELQDGTEHNCGDNAGKHMSHTYTALVKNHGKY